MAKTIWKDAFENLNPEKRQKQAVWHEILAKQDRLEKQKKKFSSRGKSWKRAAVAFLCLAFVLAGIFSWDIVIGKIALAWNYMKQQSGKEEEIIENMTDYRMRIISPYGPNLIDCSEKQLIFAGSAGLVIYDRQRKTVAAVADLQAIDCNYFDGQKLETRFVPEGSDLFIYNVKDGRPQGNCFRFDLSGCDASKGQVLKAAETLSVTQELQNSWKKRRKNSYCDTFDTFLETDAYSDSDLFDGGSYSEYALRWRDDAGREQISCLAIGGDRESKESYAQSLKLYTLKKGTASVSAENLEFEAGQSGQAQSKKQPLPQYNLICGNAMEQALVNWGVKHPLQFNLGSKTGKKMEREYEEKGDEEYREEYFNDLFVPVVQIYSQKKGEDVTRVYGCIGSISYTRIGNTLYALSGHSGLYCAWLKETKEGWRVVKMLRPRDGSFYRKDMIAFCDGDEAWYKKHISSVNEKKNRNSNAIWDKQKRQIKQYLERHNLKLQIYD